MSVAQQAIFEVSQQNLPMNTNPSDTPVSDPSVVLISPEGIILEAHDAVCAALGWPREELLNKGMSDLFEYGGDLLMSRLGESADISNPELAEGFSVSALVRRQDQTNFPVTAVVRPVPALNCFSLGFDDLAIELPQTNGAAVSEPELTEPVAEVPDVIFARRAPIEEPVVSPAPAPVAEETELPHSTSNGNSHGNENGNGNGHGNSNGNGAPKFRNIFLSGDRKTPSAEDQAAEKAKNEMAAQLEAERLERRRLEGRVVALNDQLQQLHVQLKNNLEAESTYTRRVAECENEVRQAEEGKVALEELLREADRKRERVEQDFAQFKVDAVKREEERNAWQKEWISKLQSSLAALQESDGKLEKEVASRRGIGVKLQLLQQEVCAHSAEASAEKIESAPRTASKPHLDAPRKLEHVDI